MSARPPFGLPLAPLPPSDRLSLQIEALRDEAKDQGLGTLAYLLECALIEARHQIHQQSRDVEEGDARPGDLWRPIS